MKPKFKLALAISLLVSTLIACGTTGNASSTGTLATPQATGTSPQAFRVGDLVHIGSWDVKLNSVKTSHGGSITAPKSGNVFLLISVTLTNTSSSSQSLSTLISFKLQDANGQSYNETVVSGAPNPPDGTVAAGSKTTGDIEYEVPKAVKSFSLSFQPDLTSTDQATWTITV